MEISGSHRIPASREAVWAALEDPEIVKACLPGCDRLEETSLYMYQGEIAAKVGPVAARFVGTAARVDAEAPERFSLIADGSAGDAGMAKGRADVTLVGEGGETVVEYAASGDVGGKIAQLGGRLVSGVARQTIERFFAQLAALAETGALTAAVADAPPLVHEEPAEAAAATIEDAPPLAAATTAPSAAKPIAPTATPEIPDAAELAAKQASEPPAAGAGAMTRIMLIAAAVVVIGVLVYYMIWQAPH